MSGLGAMLSAAHAQGRGPRVTHGLGSSNAVPDLVGCEKADVLVVASARTAGSVPVASSLLAAGATGYHSVCVNPSTAQALALSAVIERRRPRAVVAIGGGSVMDLAKAARIVRPTAKSLDAALEKDPTHLRSDPPALIAVPTTAGTGSEVTPFATLYRDNEKVSLDVPEALPTRAVLDGTLIRSCPPVVATAAALDALCHAIESSWSPRATFASQPYASAAGKAIVACLRAGGSVVPRDTAQLHTLLLASTVAGLAIAETRTTAAHAFSYRLTARHGVPHGFACALSLAWLARYNWHERGRGAAGLAGVLERLGCHPDAAPDTPVAAAMCLLASSIREGVFRAPALTDEELAAYLQAGLRVRGRADNNPVPLIAEDLPPWVTASGVLQGRTAGSDHTLHIRESLCP